MEPLCARVFHLIDLIGGGGGGGGNAWGRVVVRQMNRPGMFAPFADTVLLGLWRQESRDEIKP